MSRDVDAELARIERAALAQLVDNVQRADDLLAQLERAFPLAAGRIRRIRGELFRLPASYGGRRRDADDELARAWRGGDDDA